jgi:multidrug/hemolysin transport system permease protein
MVTLNNLIKRNVKLFFKDKGMFFTALVNPIILLGLYAIFLGDVYKDAFVTGMKGVQLSDGVLNSLVGGQLISSILSVSCVTVAFCTYCIMVEERVNGTIKDLRMSPLRKSILSLSYYVSTLISTLIICFIATAISLIYISTIGWYMTFADVVLLFLDVLVLSLFGTALSSVVNHFVRSQGQLSAVSSIITVGYGFICGAYMPISTLNATLKNILVYMPGTYGTSLIRTHAMQGMFSDLERQGVPAKVMEKLKDAIDCSPKLFGENVTIGGMYLILGVSILVLMGVYIMLNTIKKRKKKNK